MSMDFGKGSRAIAFNPSGAFPLDARTYFESLQDAEFAASVAEEVGSTNTIYHFGMKLLVYENEVYTWYQISKDRELIPEANVTSPLPQPVSTEAKMNEILASATGDNVGTIYKYMGTSTDTYEQGALYIIAEEVPDGDEVNYG